MSDLLENSVTKVEKAPLTASPTSSSPPPAFPPPKLSDNSNGRRFTILGIIAALAFVLAVGMGLLWMSANSATGDAEAARDIAIADAEASATGQANLEAELATARSDLGAAQASTDALTAQRDGAAAELKASADDLVELRTQASELTVDNEQLADEIGALGQELESVQAEMGADAASFDTDANPHFARYIGETLTSRNGSSRLEKAQSECFSAALVNDIGLDSLGKGLMLNAFTADNNIVIGAMQRAASTCSISLDLIF